MWAFRRLLAALPIEDVCPCQMFADYNPALPSKETCILYGLSASHNLYLPDNAHGNTRAISFSPTSYFVPLQQSQVHAALAMGKQARCICSLRSLHVRSEESESCIRYFDFSYADTLLLYSRRCTTLLSISPNKISQDFGIPKHCFTLVSRRDRQASVFITAMTRS